MKRPAADYAAAERFLRIAKAANEIGNPLAEAAAKRMVTEALGADAVSFTPFLHPEQAKIVDPTGFLRTTGIIHVAEDEVLARI